MLIACGSPVDGALADASVTDDARVADDASAAADASAADDASITADASAADDASVTSDASAAIDGGPPAPLDPTPGPFEGRWSGHRDYYHASGLNGTGASVIVSAGEDHILIEFEVDVLTDGGFERVIYCSFTALRSESQLSITGGRCDERRLGGGGSGEAIFDRGSGGLVDDRFSFRAWGTSARGANVRLEFTRGRRR